VNLIHVHKEFCYRTEHLLPCVGSTVHDDIGAVLASYPMGTRGSFRGVKRPGREADHSPPSSAEVRNAWSYTSSPQYVFMAWCLVKHRDNFIFILLKL
jgi:hypothetical protein